VSFPSLVELLLLLQRSISCSIVRAVQIRLTRPLVAQMNKERLMKMAGAVRTGGKGTMRR
jgi:hypothetical protein